MGRPGMYAEWITEDGLMKIKGAARDGWSNKQIAEELIGITYTTLAEWMKRFPELADAIKKGRKPVVENVVDAFYKNCDDRIVTETKEEITEHPDGQKTKKITRYKKVIPGNPTLIIFALKNLKPDLFGDKKDVKVVADQEAIDAVEEFMHASDEDAE